MVLAKFPQLPSGNAQLQAGLGAGPLYVGFGFGFGFGFGIDSLDPAFAPNTGTLEIGELTIPQVLELIGGLDWLSILGADGVEVGPPYDPQGTAALIATNIAFQLPCILPGVR